MKFTELPEGYYYIHAVRDKVFLEKCVPSEDWPIQLDVGATEVVHDGREFRKYGRVLNEMEIEFKTRKEMRSIQRSRSSMYGNVKRRLNANERLIGKTLELALDLLPPSGADKYTGDIARKLEAGERLTDYEHHIMVDVLLLHARLG